LDSQVDNKGRSIFMKVSEYKKQEAVTIKDVRRFIIEGENKDAVEGAKALINKGVKSKEIIVDGVTQAMEHLDKKCTIEHFNLLELMLAGRAAMDVIDYLLADEGSEVGTLIHSDQFSKKKIILGTIKGDIHEIGKNIVSMVMKTHGYHVVDLGKDIDPNDFVMAAIDHRADVIGVSSLITTTIAHVRQVREHALKKGFGTVKILAGGAVLRQADSEYLQVDYVAEDAFDAVRFVKGL
jgi:methylmalonyl-CoA mutase cobalamin-binding domain/chain